MIAVLSLRAWNTKRKRKALRIVMTKQSGLGEPAFPPVFGALANGLYQVTGKRFYDQPFKLD